VLRFATLGEQSFWLDEAITVDLLRNDLVGMLRAIPDSESTPPLYYLLAWPWAKVFGTGEIGLRAFSALCGTATVPVAYAAGAALASRRAGLIAALLVATSPLLVWYSQEARAYALLVLCGALSFWLFASALRRPTGGTLAGWAAASALALASHYFAVFPVAAEAALLIALGSRPRALTAASAAVGAVGLALLPLALHQERGGRTSWIADVPLAERVEDVAREFVAGFYPLAHAAKLAVLVVAAVIAFLVFRARAETRRAAFIALGVGALILALPLLLALAGHDYFLARNVIVAWVPVAIFLAIALASERARPAGAAVAGILVVASTAVVAATASRSDLARDDWRTVADTLATPGQKLVVVAPEYERVPLVHYRPDVRPVGDRLVAVTEIVLLGYPVEDDGFPPRWFRVPGGFSRVESRLFDRIRLVRFRASRARRLGADDVRRARAASVVVLVDRGGR
jgi:4-amino-4-deoxy-L-arabinose transferase-like glycosyltransferase